MRYSSEKATNRDESQFVTAGHLSGEFRKFEIPSKTRTQCCYPMKRFACHSASGLVCWLPIYIQLFIPIILYHFSSNPIIIIDTYPIWAIKTHLTSGREMLARNANVPNRQSKLEPRVVGSQERGQIPQPNCPESRHILDAVWNY